MDMFNMHIWAVLGNIIRLLILIVSLIIIFFLHRRNTKKRKFAPKQQKIVDKTIQDEEYITSYIKKIIEEKYPENYEFILGKLKKKTWFTSKDIQQIAVEIKKIDENSVIDEFLLALSIEYIGKEIYGLVRTRPKFPPREWNKIVRSLMQEYNLKVDAKFHIDDI